MAISFLDFFGSDPSKMNQTSKFRDKLDRIFKVAMEPRWNLIRVSVQGH